MELINGNYSIQGVSPAEICETFGSPVYVYDASIIKNQIKRLRDAFAGVDLRIKFAAKALTNVSILRLMHAEGVGVDVVSIEEARLALHAGFTPAEITFTPNGVAFDEVKEAVTLGLFVNLDNLPSLEKFGQAFGASVPCSIRLNPAIMAGGNMKIATGHRHAKFGIAVEQLADINATVAKYKLAVHGLHIHSGSEISEPSVFLKMAEVFFDVATEFPHLKFLDFGGGFKVAYKEGDHATDMNAIGQELTTVFNSFCNRTGKKLELWIEPGKFLVSEAGLLLATVNVVKETPTLTFVGLNTGLNHLIRPMMYEAYHQIINISNPTGALKKYDVVGYICETDTLGAARELNEVREGDILAILNAGAYGYSMASNYNSRLRPAEVLVSDGKAKLIRERESFEDLLRGQKG